MGPDDARHREVLMIDEILTSHTLTMQRLRQLVDDVAPSELFRQPAGVPNHPGWTLGHLSYSFHALLGELGIPPYKDWSRLFGTGSIPLPEPSAYPTKNELLQELTLTQRRLTDRLKKIGDSGLATPLEPGSSFRTVGHAALHIMVAHTALHVGQVSVWRRAAGYDEPFAAAFERLKATMPKCFREPEKEKEK
jgi:hypothetical protein